MKALLGCLFFLLIWSNSQQNAMADPEVRIAYKLTSVRVPVVEVQGLTTVQIRLNGQGPFTFVLDTGAELITVEPRVAQRLGLPHYSLIDSKFKISGLGENSVDGYRSRVAALQLADLDLQDQEVVVLHTTFPYDGILGAPFFRALVVGIDPQEKMLTLTLPQHFEVPKEAVSLSLTEISQFQPALMAEVDGIPVALSVDTGCDSSTALLSLSFVKTHQLKEHYSHFFELEGTGVGGSFPTRMVRAESFKVGSFTLTRPRMELAVGGGGPSDETGGLLCNGFFRRFNATFDYTRHRLLLIPNSAYAEVEPPVRLGIARKPGTATILLVMIGSPAERAGLKSGDQILAIDGKPFEQLSEESITQKNSQPPGTRIRFEVLSGQSRHAVEVTLADAI